MDLIPEEELNPKTSFNFAPMIDFLFLMLALFATLAVTRATLFDTQLSLAQLKPETGAERIHSKEDLHQINLSISDFGEYKWITEIHSYPMDNVQKIQQEIARQYSIAILPSDKTKTQVLLHIDKKAPWDPIAQMIFGIREIGFEVHPIYEPLDEKDNL